MDCLVNVDCLEVNVRQLFVPVICNWKSENTCCWCSVGVLYSMFHGRPCKFPQWINKAVL